MRRRRNYTPEEKFRILKKDSVDRPPFSDELDGLLLQTTVSFRCRKEFFEQEVLTFGPHTQIGERDFSQTHEVTGSHSKAQ